MANVAKLVIIKLTARALDIKLRPVKLDAMIVSFSDRVDCASRFDLNTRFSCPYLGAYSTGSDRRERCVADSGCGISHGGLLAVTGVSSVSTWRSPATRF